MPPLLVGPNIDPEERVGKWPQQKNLRGSDTAIDAGDLAVLVMPQSTSHGIVRLPAVRQLYDFIHQRKHHGFRRH